MDKYVIFDIDGTLNETAKYAVECYHKALHRRNIYVDDATIISCIGLSPEAIIEKLFGDLSEKEDKAWRSEIRDSEAIVMKEKARPFEGMEETLQILKERHYKLGICSNAYPDHIHNVLSTIGLESYFDQIGVLETGNSKADTLRLFLKTNQCDHACMVGDRIFDVEAARANDIPVVGCAYGYAPGEIQSADIVVSKPLEIVEAVEKLMYDEE